MLEDPKYLKYLLYSREEEFESCIQSSNAVRLPIRIFPKRKEYNFFQSWKVVEGKIIFTKCNDLDFPAIKGFVIPTNKLARELEKKIEDNLEMKDFYYKGLVNIGTDARVPIPQQFRFIYNSNNSNNKNNKLLFKGNGSYFILSQSQK